MIHRPEQATTAIAATQLTRAADLLDLLDGFLRTGNGVADRLRYHLDTTTADHPDRPGYDANLVIDLVGLATHARHSDARSPSEQFRRTTLSPSPSVITAARDQLELNDRAAAAPSSTHHETDTDDNRKTPDDESAVGIR